MLIGILNVLIVSSFSSLPERYCINCGLRCWTGSQVLISKLHFYLEKDIDGLMGSQGARPTFCPIFFRFMHSFGTFWSFGLVLFFQNPGPATETFSKIQSPHNARMFGVQFAYWSPVGLNENLFSIWRSEGYEYLTYAHFSKAISSLVSQVVILTATGTTKRAFLLVQINLLCVTITLKIAAVLSSYYLWIVIFSGSQTIAITTN